MRKIAIIGASGFVGSTLVERLVARGDNVLPYIHTSGSAWRLARLGIPLRTLNVLDSAQTEAALDGVTHVVNCARGGEEVMLRGLKNVLAAALKRKVARFIHMSSVAVYGDPPPPKSAHEDAPTKPAIGSYGWIKLKQDHMVMRACRNGLSSVILCPPNISGPYSDYLVNLLNAMRLRAFVLLDDGSAPCNLVDVDNLSAAIELALDHGPADGTRIFVTDDEAICWRSVVDYLEALGQLTEPVPQIGRERLSSMTADIGAQPTSLIRSLKHLASNEVRQALRKDPLFARFDTTLRKGIARVGKRAEQFFRMTIDGPTRVSKVTGEGLFDLNLCRQQLRGVRHLSDRARDQLGYRPVHSFVESMDAFCTWYRHHHAMDSAFWPLLAQLY